MKRIILPYNPGLKQLARDLRNKSTQTEIMLWNEIKGKKLGYDFHRQKPLLNYIVDFFCYELMLAIEIDGEGHAFQEVKDIRRQKELEELGIRFLRFSGTDVFYELEKVVKEIEEWIVNNSYVFSPTARLHTPTPLKRGKTVFLFVRNVRVFDVQ